MPFIEEPHWYSYRTLKRQNKLIRPELLSWLLEPSSLTVRLKQHCQHFRVEVLAQYWGRVFLSEGRQLGVPEWRWANIREVKLICDGAPWVFARTIIPRATLTGTERKLLTLGNKPLGQLLFNHPHMQRSEFELAEIKKPHYHFQKARTGLENDKTVLYGRRSLFFLSGKPLSLTEVFTSGFPY